MLLGAFLICWVACSRKKPPAPQDLYAQVRLTFLHGDLAQARIEADKAYKQFAVADLPWAWKFRLLEADVLAKQGLSQEILALLNSDLPESLAGDDLAVRKHMLEALAYSHLGRFPDADDHLHEAERLCGLTHCQVMGEVARIGGVVEADRNEPEKAAILFRRSLQIARQQGDQYLELSDLLNLGVVAIAEEHFDESVDWSNDALTVAHTLQAGLTEEKALGNLGWAYYKMGDFDKSLDDFVAASRQAHELGAVIDEVEWLNNQGLVYFQLGRFTVAEHYYLQSLSLARTSQNKVQIMDALTALAFVSVKTEQLENAKRYSDETLRLSHDQNDRPAELSAWLVQGEIAGASADLKRAEELLLRVARDPQSDASMQWEARHNLAVLYESDRPEEADAQYRESLNILEAARSSLHHEEYRLPFLSNAVPVYDDYVRFLLKRGENAEALQVADYDRAQTLLEGLRLLPPNAVFRPPPMNARRVAAAMRCAVLFYWLGKDESYLWVATPRESKLFRLPPAAEIDGLVRRYRKALVGALDVLETANPDGQQLYNLLIAPAQKLISGNPRVLVIPDGSLNSLNFETLLVSTPVLHYWIEDATITNANSLRLLASRHSEGKNGGKLLLIGDAVSPDPQYGDLPNAGEEMNGVRDHFDGRGTRVFARYQATPAAYLASQPAQYAYIHFVAHGTASELSPLDSAIVLSKSATDSSFKLYAREIIQHPLRADLVTISSCYGEGTRAYTGEGLVGLSWAFLRAGAHNVIGALWEASDTSTPQLMDSLYDRLRKGEPPAEALRHAKLGMLHSKVVFRKPFYWAPFRLYVGQ